MPSIWEDINIGRPAYGYSPSGPGPYAPQMQRPVRDLQPYAGPRSPVDRGSSYYLQSPSGPQGMSMQPPTRFDQAPPPRPPETIPPQPQQSPTSWMDQLQKMLQNATTGLDPARTGIQGMFGQQQPRTIQTTDPGAGYGMSPSGPTAQMPTGQPQPQRQNVTEQFSVPANYGSSPSNPNWGQDDKGRLIGKSGPTNVPASTNYNAISPSNRIAGNVAAVMQGRTGPSPGVTPHLNQSGRLESPPNARPWTGFGPTGQPLPSRQHVRKPMSPYYQPGG